MLSIHDTNGQFDDFDEVDVEKIERELSVEENYWEALHRYFEDDK